MEEADAGDENITGQTLPKNPPPDLTKQTIDQQRLDELEEKVKVLTYFSGNVSKSLDDLYPPSVDNSPRHGTTLDSYLLNHELHKIGSSLHIPDISPYINVTPNNWQYKHSHAWLIMKLFSNPDSIIDLQQLKPLQQSTKKCFPVNIYFLSPLQRKIAVDYFASICKNKGFPAPTIHYSLNNNPKLKRNTSFLSKILYQLKQEKHITAYSLNNFATTKDYGLVPLYSIKVQEGYKWTPYLESYTLKLFRNGETFNTNKGENSKLFALMKQEIIEHVTAIKAKKPTKPTLQNAINDAMKHPKKRKHEKHSPEMRKSGRVISPTTQSLPDTSLCTSPVLTAPSFSTPPPHPPTAETAYVPPSRENIPPPPLSNQLQQSSPPPLHGQDFPPLNSNPPPPSFIPYPTPLNTNYATSHQHTLEQRVNAPQGHSVPQYATPIFQTNPYYPQPYIHHQQQQQQQQQQHQQQPQHYQQQPETTFQQQQSSPTNPFRNYEHQHNQYQSAISLSDSVKLITNLG